MQQKEQLQKQLPINPVFDLDHRDSQADGPHQAAVANQERPASAMDGQEDGPATPGVQIGMRRTGQTDRAIGARGMKKKTARMITAVTGAGVATGKDIVGMIGKQ